MRALELSLRVGSAGTARAHCRSCSLILASERAAQFEDARAQGRAMSRTEAVSLALGPTAVEPV